MYIRGIWINYHMSCEHHIFQTSHPLYHSSCSSHTLHNFWWSNCSSHFITTKLSQSDTRLSVPKKNTRWHIFMPIYGRHFEKKYFWIIKWNPSAGPSVSEICFVMSFITKKITQYKDDQAVVEILFRSSVRFCSYFL